MAMIFLIVSFDFFGFIYLRRTTGVPKDTGKDSIWILNTDTDGPEKAAAAFRTALCLKLKPIHPVP
jgi:hypothetical protein